MKRWAEKFYKSKSWQECRKGYIQSVNGLCESCLERSRIKPGKIVHHKIVLMPDNINNPEITLNWKHLILMCQDCHNREHHGNGEVIREGLTFDATGDIVKSPL